MPQIDAALGTNLIGSSDDRTQARMWRCWARWAAFARFFIYAETREPSSFMGCPRASKRWVVVPPWCDWKWTRYQGICLPTRFSHPFSPWITRTPRRLGISVTRRYENRFGLVLPSCAEDGVSMSLLKFSLGFGARFSRGNTRILQYQIDGYHCGICSYYIASRRSVCPSF